MKNKYVITFFAYLIMVPLFSVPLDILLFKDTLKEAINSFVLPAPIGAAIATSLIYWWDKRRAKAKA